MKRTSFATVAACLLLFAVHVPGAVLYVDQNSPNPTPPFFSSWSTAATNIQDAIDAANPGDEVLVTNGVYATGGKVMAGDLTNRIALDKAITVQSVNGPWVTVIQGAGATNGPLAVRCAWLTNGAALNGFTLRGGATRSSGIAANQTGGAAWCASSTARLVSCVVQSNSAVSGGAVFSGWLSSCFVTGNSGANGIYGSVLNSCTVTSNNLYGVSSGAQATNCIVYFNGPGGHYNWSASVFAYCCTTPQPSGPGNQSGNPQLATDGIHLTAASPCIDAGTNVVTGTDIFGQPWASPPSLGCAEWQRTPSAAQPQIQLLGAPVGFQITDTNITGQPPFTFQWLKDGAPVQDNGHYSSAETSSLYAVGILASDAGSYQLVVSNAFGVVTSAVAQIVIHFVDIGSTTPISPYFNWTTAATNIEDAIDAAAAGEIILVTNGIYASGGKALADGVTDRVAVDKPLAVTSVNGYSSTVIEGAWDPATINGPLAARCAALTDGAVLNGFTLRGGATRAGSGDLADPSQNGGGAWCSSTNAIVSNCFVTNNAAGNGAGFFGGTLNNSLLINNRSSFYGAGACSATLNNCTVLGNATMTQLSGLGAGTYNCMVRNSIVLDNFDWWLLGPRDNYSYDSLYASPRYSYSCTSPLISGSGNVDGNGLNPQFLDEFHIAATSPCRGVGSALYSSGTDLDGEVWADPPSMGCDEVVVSNLVGPLSVGLFVYQTNLLVGRSAFFSGWITGRAARVSWSFGDGPTVTNLGASADHLWSDAGDYTVIFTAYNNDNPGGVSADAIIHILPLISPALQMPTVTTNGFEFQFTAQQNANYVVEVATNLAAPINWQVLQYIYYSPGGTVQVTDTPPTNGMRFYRVQVQ